MHIETASSSDGSGRVTILSVDPLTRDDIERMRATPPEVKARQAFDAMRTGINLERASLRVRHPDASEADIEAMLRAWLEAE
jgi:hypothetical protein